MSTLVLVGTYIIVAYATTAYKGPAFLENHPDDVLTGMVGGWPAKLMMIAILTSAMASTQTTILPTARTVAVDGRARGAAEVARQDPPEVPDADVVDVVVRHRLGRLVDGPRR